MNLRKSTVKSARPPSKQKGVALITALVISTIVITLASTIIYRQQIQIRLSSNISTLEQNYQYAIGMENFAATILQRSFEDQPGFVSLEDDWNNDGKDIVLPITNGLMTGKLYDLQARINLNTLVRESKVVEKKDEATEKVTTIVTNYAAVSKERLTRLIQILDEEQEMGPPENFTVILKDWIDEDQDNGNPIPHTEDQEIGNGAESPSYQSLQPAYFSAGVAMISPTELRLLKDMKEAIYTKLVPEISTLPITLSDNTPSEIKINVNTASENVLKAIGFTPDIVTHIVETRKDTPFETIDKFKEDATIKAVLKQDENDDDNPDLIDPLDLDIASRYFLLQGKVEINNTRLFINSTLYRNNNGQFSVIMRDFSNPQTIKKASN